MENKDDGDGHGEARDLKNTENVEDIQTILDRQSIQGTFSSPEHSDNVRVLLTPGDVKELNALLMRSASPSKRFLLGTAVSLTKCKQHGFKGGEEFFRIILAGLPGIQGKRAELFSDTIIGESHRGMMAKQQGILGKVKTWATGGQDTP